MYVRLALRVAVLAGLAAFAAGCTTETGPVASTGTAPVEQKQARAPRVEVKTAEQVRLRIKDACMYEAGQANNPRQSTQPGCMCYAQKVVKAMSPAEIDAYMQTATLADAGSEINRQAWESCKIVRHEPAKKPELPDEEDESSAAPPAVQPAPLPASAPAPQQADPTEAQGE